MILTNEQIWERLERDLSVAEILDLPGFRVTKTVNPRTTRRARYMIQGVNTGPAVKGTIRLIWSPTEFRAAIAGVFSRVLPVIEKPLWHLLVQRILDEVQVVEVPDRRRRRPDKRAQIGGGAPNPKQRIRVRADLLAELPPKRRLTPKPVAPVVRRRPAAQLDDLRPLCEDCGVPFVPGRSEGQDRLCPVDWSNRQPVVRQRRRGGLPEVPLGAFGFERGGYIMDDPKRGPVERLKRWGRGVLDG